MTTTNRTRAARLLLAGLDDDPAAAAAVLDEAHADPEHGLPGLLASLTEGMLELLVGTLGEDSARATLNLTLLNLSLTDPKEETSDD